MDKESLSQYGWVIIIIVVLAILIGIAPNFAGRISENVNDAVNKFEVIANNGGIATAKDYTEYSMDDIDGNILVAVGKSSEIYAVAKFSDDGTAVNITKNTKESDGKLVDFSAGRGLNAITKTAILHEGITYIGSYSLYNSPNVTVTIPESVTEIHDNAFVGCDNLTIKGEAGSYAETYANAKGYTFIAI